MELFFTTDKIASFLSTHADKEIIKIIKKDFYPAFVKGLQLKSIGFCVRANSTCQKTTKKKRIISEQERIFDEYIKLVINEFDQGTFPLDDYYKNNTISEDDISIIKSFLEEMKQYCKNTP